MKILMNFTTAAEDVERYTSNADFKSFYRGLGLDGVELMRFQGEYGGGGRGIVTADDIVGVHMKYFPSWMDLWTGNTGRLLAEFGGVTAARNAYGEMKREALTAAFIENMNAPPAADPAYFVFHVSECTLEEVITRRALYSSETVVNAATELVNSFAGAIRGTPFLLFENLWYPGLTMTEPELTRKLLEGVSYPHTGVMFDVGHLLNYNTSLRTPDEGVDYSRNHLQR